MSRRLSLLILLWPLLLGATGAGDEEPEETEDLGTAERTVLGWHPESGELFVRLSSRGERMVSGVGKPYYFRATEIYGDGSELIERFKAGPPVGPVHPVYFSARPATDLKRRVDGLEPRGASSFRDRLQKVLPAEATGLEDVDLSEPVQAWRSPTGMHVLTMHGYTEFEPWEHPFRGTQYKCVQRQRVVLIDAIREVAVVTGEWTESGEPATRQEDVICPQSQVATYWHPEGTHWVISHTVTAPFSRPATLLTGRVDAGSFANARPLLALSRPFKSLEEPLDDGPLKTLATALETGELPRPNRIRSLYNQAFRAAKEPAQYLLVGDVLLDIDPSLAIRALERALKDATELTDDTLHHLLIDALASTAREADALKLIQSLDEPSLPLRARAVELGLRHLSPADAVTITATLLFQEPGNCRAYQVHGLALGRANRAADALHQFQAAFTCDPELTDALYMWADLVYLAGRTTEAHHLVDLYLTRAKPRRGDDIRDARRERFEELLKALPPS